MIKDTQSWLSLSTLPDLCSLRHKLKNALAWILTPIYLPWQWSVPVSNHAWYSCQELICGLWRHVIKLMTTVMHLQLTIKFMRRKNPLWQTVKLWKRKMSHPSINVYRLKWQNLKMLPKVYHLPGAHLLSRWNRYPCLLPWWFWYEFIFLDNFFWHLMLKVCDKIHLVLI